MMKIGSCLLLSAALLAGAAQAQTGTKPVELKEITDGAFSQRTSVGEIRSLPDGEHYTAMNADQSMIIRYSYRTGQPVDTLFNAKKARECHFDDIDNYVVSSTGYHILLFRETEYIYRRSYKAMVYDYDVRRNYVSPLTDSGEKVMIPTFSPDGRMVAFVRDGNIWIRKFDYDTETQVTNDAVPNKIINGITDWVYEEEFTETNMMTWSPDSNILAFVRFDESQVPEYNMQVFGKGTYPGIYRYKYPKAGEPNSRVSLMAYNVDTKDTKNLEVPVDSDSYIPRITFTTNSEQLAVMTLNRDQNLFNMYYANPKSGVFRLILHEENKRYIDSDWLFSIHFYKNCFTYVSERDGYAHIYLHTPTGLLLRQVTKGPWDVTRLYGYDEATQTVYYQSAEGSPLRRAIYKINAKGEKTELSTQEGTNDAAFSANFAYYVNRYSNLSTPMLITVNESKNGKALRVLEDNAALKEQLKQYAFPVKEFTKVHTAAGLDLNAWILKPLHFDPSKKYPVLMIQYSGPNSQQVLDSYSFGWEYYLASHGILVASVDGRGTGARGENFRKCTYMKMGLLESQDQADAARALGKLPYVDAGRIGIWGWSFGGYNTLMALSTGKGAFELGIAVAPPSDWRYYDTVYTERYMRTPQENPAGYDATSPIKLAAHLQGKLLLIHGTGDDNVTFNQTMAYAEALVQAGKQFDMQIYKDRNHNISGGNTRFHLYTRMSDFLFKNL
ncbi:MAG: S9 family peptidase [Tannerella sp.]|jgi:dipeptidyl-peptidase-4|nr:S9 family peptidase [Tannerella sp.]